MLQALAIVLGVAVKGAEMVLDELKFRKREKTNKALESKMNEAIQDLSTEIKALQKYFRKFEESTKNEVHIIRGELEKKQEKKDEERSRALESMLDQKFGELSQKFQTLEEDVHEWKKASKHEVELLRDDLEKQGKNEILEAIESMMNENLGQLPQKFQTLEEDVHEWKEASKREVELLRDDLEKQEKNDEERSRALESMLEQKLGQLSQKIQTLEEFVQEWPETTKREVQLLRDDLEKQGKEEKEIVRALESLLIEKLRELSQKIQTLEEDVHQWPETTKREVQLLRVDLENRGKKEEENLLALRCGMAMLYQQLSQGFQTLQFRQELPYHEFPLFRRYLAYNHGDPVFQHGDGVPPEDAGGRGGYWQGSSNTDHHSQRAQFRSSGWLAETSPSPRLTELGRIPAPQPVDERYLPIFQLQQPKGERSSLDCPATRWKHFSIGKVEAARALREVQDFSHSSGAEAFSILPLSGVLQPGQSQQVSSTFSGHPNSTSSVRELCHLEGGPTCEVLVTGEASGVSSSLSPQKISCGSQAPPRERREQKQPAKELQEEANALEEEERLKEEERWKKGKKGVCVGKQPVKPEKGKSKPAETRETKIPKKETKTLEKKEKKAEEKKEIKAPEKKVTKASWRKETKLPEKKNKPPENKEAKASKKGEAKAQKKGGN